MKPKEVYKRKGDPRGRYIIVSRAPRPEGKPPCWNAYYDNGKLGPRHMAFQAIVCEDDDDFTKVKVDSWSQERIERIEAAGGFDEVPEN